MGRVACRPGARHLTRQFARVLVGAGLWLSVTVAFTKSYVAVPAVAWDALVPYVRANIVPELAGEDLRVFVCPEHTDRSAVTPFDDALADFTRVLITQSMRTDRRVADAVAAATGAFRAQVPGFGPEERAHFREMFWRSLSRSPDLLPRLQSIYLKARKDGRLRCWLCDKEPGYAPAARRIP
jgi:hypothetical protein